VVKEWSPYGTLRRAAAQHEGLAVWYLANSAGEPILHFVTRTGGSLARYEGQTISVLGTAIESSQSSMRPMLRVSHIALP
jgi:hypothetical protein